ncbi:MAG: acetyl/propionyl/methylcrotonyl-CoA carboxylase subunit alpha [Proteobacteria bacterium]|nr:acetyl/propionyl/methylcrotonyl-CoA carboxylase subunit alpha [Pseudomonadota bacterium]
MVERLLIANRGEIAVRVARTARRMGIRTIAVYSEADAQALHVAACDEALPVGGPAPKDSYLRAEAILAAAKKAGADSVHPGYGFLSENAGFAQACADAGLVFVGPPPSAIRAMGGKSEAKALMVEAGVPVVPGYHGTAQDIATLAKEAAKTGYPVLIKASAGGGGKGMRIVAKPADLAEAVAGAQREAQSSFGDPRVLIERYLDRPRHIEVQVFCDAHANGVYLFERDCSLQRRHQKVIEEAPAPGMTAARRKAMGEAAVRAAKAVGYVGAGTVEFIADQAGEFFFMEMNTRLQVEHPVTEAITGLDLVEWQLRVASGEKLPLAQGDLRIAGHAFEARIYAEDPARDFLPATGKLHRLVFPAQGNGVRVDTGIREGDSVTIHYDPMIAKLIVHGADRAQALRKLADALSGVRVAGIANNVAFLARVARHKAFAAGEIDTGFIQRNAAELLPAPAPADDATLALATLGVLLTRAHEARTAATATNDPHSPWSRSDGWRLNGDSHDALMFADGAATVRVDAHYRKAGYVLDLPGGPLPVSGTLAADGALVADLAGHRVTAHLVRHANEWTLFRDGESRTLALVDPLAAAESGAASDARLVAPMPGKIVAVHVKAGESVVRGQKLVVLEAMKMEHTILAPMDGTVERVRFQPGEQTSEGEELVVFVAKAE